MSTSVVAVKTYRTSKRKSTKLDDSLSSIVDLQEALKSCVDSCPMDDVHDSDSLTLYGPDDTFEMRSERAAIDGYNGDGSMQVVEAGGEGRLGFNSTVDADNDMATSRLLDEVVEVDDATSRKGKPTARRRASSAAKRPAAQRRKSDGGAAAKRLVTPTARQFPGDLEQLLLSMGPGVNVERVYNSFASKTEPYCCLCSAYSDTKVVDEQSVIAEWTASMTGKKPENSPVILTPDCFASTTNTAPGGVITGAYGMGGALLTCQQCAVCVHAACYGVTMMPADRAEWRCDKCRGKALLARCCLCNMRGGALKRTVDNVWAHLACAMLLPGASFRNTVFKEPIATGGVDPSYLGIECVYCRSTAGGCIRCLHRGCAASFHASCGSAAGASISRRPGEARFVVICREHSPSEAHRLRPDQHVYARLSDGQRRKGQLVDVTQTTCRVVLFDDGSVADDLGDDQVTVVSANAPLTPGSRVNAVLHSGELQTGRYQGTKLRTRYSVQFNDSSRGEFGEDDVCGITDLWNGLIPG